MQDQITTFRLADLTFGSLFTIAFWVNVSIWLILLVLALFAAAEDPSSFSMNGEEAESLTEALPIILTIFPIIGGFASAFTALVSAGILTAVGPRLPLSGLRLKESAQPTDPYATHTGLEQ